MIKDYLSAIKPSLTGHTEVRAQRSGKRAVAFLNGNMVSNVRTDESGVSARVYKNGVYGFASGAEYTPSSIGEIIAAAERNAGFMDSRVGKGKPVLPGINAGRRATEREVRDIEQKVYIDYLKELDDYIAAKYPKLAARQFYAICDSMEKLLVTSDGFDNYFLQPRCCIYAMLTHPTADGGNVELYDAFAYHGYWDEHFSTIDKLYEQLDTLYETIAKKAEGVHADAGIKDVILHPDLAGMLAHEAIGHTVEADLVLSGSVAAHNLNKRVASDLVTMIDFAHTMPDGSPAALPVLVDDEGTPAEDAVLIKDGILVGYMHSRESAQHFGVAPTGSARAFAFSDEPLIRMRNTGILPGKSKLDDMIASIEDGYFLTNTGNGQADMTGEFMFGINMGYEIKNGKLGRAIRDTTISGVAFDMLKTVDMMSDDDVWVTGGMCGKKQPMTCSMGGPAIKCKVNIGGR